MGKGTKLKNDRRMYNFSLDETDPNDMVLIEYLEKRSTTNCVRDGLMLLMKGVSPSTVPQTEHPSQNESSLNQEVLTTMNETNQLLRQFLEQQLQSKETPKNEETTIVKSNKTSKPKKTEKPKKDDSISEKKKQQIEQNALKSFDDF